MLKHRVITAVILIALLVWGVLVLDNRNFAVMAALFVMQGSWEWSRLMGAQHPLRRISYVILTAVLLYITWVLVTTSVTFIIAVLIMALLWWLCALVLVLRYPRHAHLLDNSVFSAIVGLHVLVPAWCALVVLHGGILHTTTPGPYYVIVLLMLIAVADTSAYFGGRRWGKKKLAPQVSPGKTWEGVFAAFVGVGICTTFGASLLGYTEQGWLQGLLFMMFSVVTAAFSIVGDLAESMFKRHAGVKDSGNLLPGHGGVLDRIDSVTAAAPVFVLGLISLTGVQSGVSQQSPVSAVSTHYQFNIVADASSLP